MAEKLLGLFGMDLLSIGVRVGNSLIDEGVIPVGKVEIRTLRLASKEPCPYQVVGLGGDPTESTVYARLTPVEDAYRLWVSQYVDPGIARRLHETMSRPPTV